MISGYNLKQGYGVKNLFHIIGKRLTLRGFIVSDLLAEFQKDFFNTMPKLYKSGDVKYKQHITSGIENGPQAFNDMLNGKNFGKVNYSYLFTSANVIGCFENLQKVANLHSPK